MDQTRSLDQFTCPFGGQEVELVQVEYEAGGIFDYQIENLGRRLRTHIEVDAANPQLLLTVRGLGYKLVTG